MNKIQLHRAKIKLSQIIKDSYDCMHPTFGIPEKLLNWYFYPVGEDSGFTALELFESLDADMQRKVAINCYERFYDCMMFDCQTNEVFFSLADQNIEDIVDKLYTG